MEHKDFKVLTAYKEFKEHRDYKVFRGYKEI